MADNTNSAGSWPQIGYDSRNTRHIPDARGPRDGATIAWRSLGDRPVYPPVADDALYLTEAWTGGAAFALGTEDGTEQWENTDLPPSRWAPALHEDRLLVITREEGNVVRLHALDTATGEQVWVREEGITASSTERPPISPTVRDGSIYISSNRGIIACEAATGEIEWTATLGRDIVEIDNGPTRLTVWTKPAVTANRVFTFDTNDSYQSTREVYAVDRKNGDRQWTAELEVGDRWYLKNYPVVGSDRIFISAVKAVSGGGDSGGGGSKGTGNDSEWEGGEQLFALDTESGAVAWDWELPRKTLSPPAYANGVLYVGEWYPDADTGRLHALDVRDGEILWTYRTETGAVLSPTVAEDTVYIHQDKKLAAVATADGTRRWQLEIGEWIGPPVIVGDIVYLQTNPGHSSDSQLMAIREP